MKAVAVVALALIAIAVVSAEAERPHKKLVRPTVLAPPRGLPRQRIVYVAKGEVARMRVRDGVPASGPAHHGHHAPHHHRFVEADADVEAEAAVAVAGVYNKWTDINPKEHATTGEACTVFGKPVGPHAFCTEPSRVDGYHWKIQTAKSVATICKLGLMCIEPKSLQEIAAEAEPSAHGPYTTPEKQALVAAIRTLAAAYPPGTLWSDEIPKRPLPTAPVAPVPTPAAPASQPVAPSSTLNPAVNGGVKAGAAVTPAVKPANAAAATKPVTNYKPVTNGNALAKMKGPAAKLAAKQNNVKNAYIARAQTKKL